MKIGDQYTVGEIAAFLGAKVVGNPDQKVTGINEIHRVVNGDLVFVDHPKYYSKALQSAATTILIDAEVECPEGKSLIISEKPFDDFNKLTRKFRPTILQKKMEGDDCRIADSAHLSPNCFIGNDVEIGENVVIHAGAFIGDRTILEEGVIIGPNSVIGHSAFYYKKKPEGFDRMHSCGYVHLEKNVEVGAGCTIDMGVTDVTFIGAGTKIDNQVHIGHDTRIGKDCLIAAGVGLAGCVNVGNNVTIWGQVGCASDITIGDGAVILAQSGIAKSLEGGKTYFGSPANDVKSVYREMAAMRRLPEMLDKLK